MTRRKPRGMRPDEEELWERVRSSTVPLHQNQRQILKAAVEKPKIEPAQPTLPSFSVGQAATSTALPNNYGRDAAKPEPQHMDHKRFAKLKKGKAAPERRIDLHGMTLAQAHPALTRFVLGAHESGARLILVITDKGRSDIDGYMTEHKGILKRQVPQWLRSSPLNSVVLQVVDAHQRHGGAGAYYVYLRRNR